MTALANIGTALYGRRWQSALAEALGYTDRTVRRWAAGDTPVPDHIPGELNRLIVARIALLTKLRHS